MYRFLATGDDTNGKYALWEAIVPPGGGPPHVHSLEEEGFYVLEGEITFTINGERLVATAGMFANMPVGTPHSFKNESGIPARMLISVAPAGLEQMFFEVGVPISPGSTTADPPTKDEIDRLLAAAPQYGIESRARLIHSEDDAADARDPIVKRRTSRLAASRFLPSRTQQWWPQRATAR